ncbi:ThuA domain-containing protein [Bacillus alkalicellulosilyticus]|uniref:ThuA domain-containing protein n=1 Tax=Alkalihalobacterium alkalicellulosilyticum TaxID=1912214 RepID=UPI0009971929|nr:ThuA domain-containing protein [Bacillus alkalicellulosilyticus]
MSQKVLVIGDYEEAPWHPLSAIEEQLKQLLPEHDEVDVTIDRSLLREETLSNYDLLISYVDAWEKKLAPEEIGGLLRFVAAGGRFLCIHNGVSLQTTYEYAQLVGAKFTGHPPYQTLQYNITQEHDITAGLESFKMDEELYCFEFDPFTEKTVVLECTNGEQTMPAAWYHSYGQGQVVYLAIGHDSQSFANNSFQQLVKNSIAWLASSK